MTPRGATIVTKVSELIDPISGQWDEELILSILNPVDAERILQIPLNLNAFEDFISWHATQSGILSVRSTYHLEWKHQFRGRTCMALYRELLWITPFGKYYGG
jgi:hypothetical protein